MSRLIVLVEDDHLELADVAGALQAAVAGVEVFEIWTESDFLAELDHLRSRGPDLFVLDVMLRWALPSLRVDRPSDMSSTGYWRAGVRCAKRLAQDEVLRNVPVILRSALTKADVAQELRQMPTGQNLRYLSKADGVEALVLAVQELLGES